ncbi:MULTISPECIES: alkyl/aryl-sulfatase [unclassified Agarivorans]|uniref:alkyl/aryl-sulfatase n=1 Tax=unclassified Agarivorans TaxID=2636026 RepID=UPI0026E3EC42|nr:MULTISPECIES: alkyl sulfatase dimerization domain-containing protein [unclassified Agarivorans]MDO6686384.1 alkyl sulfatase dimerization domain-containing protein [Agarivorans sp. 3_MG-2023]MDO6713686.1 alkyl sulfatase dimerization domain-containing protein [Agarivorans sp. 2_MG-2023]
MKKSILTASILSVFTTSVIAHSHDHDDHAGHDHEHVTTESLANGKGKPASVHTIEANKAFAKTLNFEDTTVFFDNDKGLVVPLDAKTSMSLRDRFKNLHTGLEAHDNSPDTVNPSLWRQGQANFAADGLYKVTDGIYQVRGTDLASTSFIKSDSGWIVYDVLMHDKAMEASLEFFLANVPEGGDEPVVAMIYSHSHADHFGGSRAVQDRFPEVKVYAPHGFIKETVDENVLAGNAMSRRAAYQYGATLGQANTTGIVDAALSNGWSQGEGYQITLVAPDQTFPSGDEQKFFDYEIDGVKFVFMDTAGTEAPSGHVAYLPEHNTLWTGEMVYQGMHNVYTLRGAKVRDSLKWSKDINEMINAWGGEVEMLMGSHSAPMWGNEKINDYMRAQRDNYGFVHNQTLRLANSGMGIQDIGASINDELPTSLQQLWHTNGYHGTYSHNARAVYNMYLGYFDMNPANLDRMGVADEAERFTQAYGGCEAGYATAKTYFDKGEYRFAGVMLDHIVRACDSSSEARSLLADNWEQQGYQAEGAGWRNVFLTGAQEIRIGTMPGLPKTASSDLLSEMTIENILDFMAVKIVATKADGKDFTLNVNVPDIKEVHYVELSNGNLNNIQVAKLAPADATLHINKADVTKILLEQTTLAALLESGKAGIEGDSSVMKTLAEVSIDFNGSFEIVPRPSKGQEVDAHIYN